MGRPPTHGAPSFRFHPSEVAHMETILREHAGHVPPRELLLALANKFSNSPERAGKITVQMKQVWNWFQNRRYALRSKLVKSPQKSNMPPNSQNEAAQVRNVHPVPQQTSIPSGHNVVRNTSENPPMEFEAKSARDGAWYDVQAFLSHRYLETGNPEVLVRFAGFGPEEDEWVNVRKHVRQRSLPCESSECVAVLPGDLILCFQEGKEQALYFDAHVLDAQRRRHDLRGCRCRFLVRYDHDQSEEIVPLRKVCRRPETDYRLQVLYAANESASTSVSAESKKPVADPASSNMLRVTNPNPSAAVAATAGPTFMNAAAAVQHAAPIATPAPASASASAPAPTPAPVSAPFSASASATSTFASSSTPISAPNLSRIFTPVSFPTPSPNPTLISAPTSSSIPTLTSAPTPSLTPTVVSGSTPLPTPISAPIATPVAAPAPTLDRAQTLAPISDPAQASAPTTDLVQAIGPTPDPTQASAPTPDPAQALAPTSMPASALAPTPDSVQSLAPAPTPGAAPAVALAATPNPTLASTSDPSAALASALTPASAPSPSPALTPASAPSPAPTPAPNLAPASTPDAPLAPVPTPDATLAPVPTPDASPAPAPTPFSALAPAPARTSASVPILSSSPVPAPEHEKNEIDNSGTSVGEASAQGNILSPGAANIVVEAKKEESSAPDIPKEIESSVSCEEMSDNPTVTVPKPEKVESSEPTMAVSTLATDGDPTVSTVAESNNQNVSAGDTKE